MGLFGNIALTVMIVVLGGLVIWYLNCKKLAP